MIHARLRACCPGAARGSWRSTSMRPASLGEGTILRSSGGEIDEAVMARGVDEPPVACGMAVGEGDVGLDVEIGAAITQVRGEHVDSGGAVDDFDAVKLHAGRTGLGRKGLRVAKTPRTLGGPPGGAGARWESTSPWRRACSASHPPRISAAAHPGVPFSTTASRWLNSSKPATACGSANSGSNTMRPCRCGAKKLFAECRISRQVPLSICAMGVISMPAPTRGTARREPEARREIARCDVLLDLAGLAHRAK